VEKVCQQSNKCADIRYYRKDGPGRVTTQSENGHLMVALHNQNVHGIWPSIRQMAKFDENREYLMASYAYFSMTREYYVVRAAEK
jgi:hypothetical protein